MQTHTAMALDFSLPAVFSAKLPAVHMD